MDEVKPFTDETNEWETLRTQVVDELDQLNNSINEGKLLLEQSQLEVNKLAQRNASITARLQQIQSNFDTTPRDDIRSVYESALEIQQRLFVIRGQVEKLHSDQEHQQRYKKFMEKIHKVFENGGEQGFSHGNARTAIVDTVENMIQAQEAERQRLSRLMHDGPAQALSNFILQTEIAMRLFDIDKEKAREELSSLKSASTNTFKKVRDFIFELRPMMLDDLGLVPTLRRYIEALQEHSGADIRFSFTGTERRLESYLEILVFRAAQELLSNAVRHSGATQVKIQFDMTETNIKVIVDDNGKGFDVAILDGRSHMGIKVIRERIEMLGGYVQVDSVIGQGTRITLQVPATNVAVIA